MEKIISTPCGEIMGTDCRLPDVIAFKGIRYATAKRWEYPKLVTKWEGVYDATAYGNCSYQPRAFYNEEENPKKAFYYNEFRKGETYTHSEDCLFLNIWVPREAQQESKLPVLFYIHGGGYTGGCGHEKHFDDPVWPTKGVIGVTVNYRLGPMGFVCLPQLKDEAGHTGNYGLYDQLAALQWVKANISFFGGDPEKVTIMGQSAGAMSVQHLCQSPLTSGLFSSAVMSSGCGINGVMSATAEKTYPFWQEVMKHCGAKTLDEFRSVSPEKLFSAWETAKKQVKGGMMATFPVKDGHFITEKPEAKKIPYMVGANSHDMLPAALYVMAKRWGIKNKAESYVWFFNRMLPGDGKGAWHSSDLWYWFGTLPNCWRPMEKKDYELSEQMVSYLCSFVKNGKPNADELPLWTPCTTKDKQVMCLGEGGTSMGKAEMRKLIITTLTNKPVGE